MSVSSAFLTPSLHVICVGAAEGTAVGITDGVNVGGGGSHFPDLHLPLLQSFHESHILPTLQAGHSGPPQSTSVSAPLMEPSAHVIGVGAAVGDDEGEGVGANVGVPEEGETVGASVGVGVLQTALSHKPLSQSPPRLHLWPAEQEWQSLPPQSTSVSVPSSSPFWHVAGVGRCVGDNVGAVVGERLHSLCTIQRTLSHSGFSAGQAHLATQ